MLDHLVRSRLSMEEKKIMNNSRPGPVDRARIRFWSKDKALKELRVRALKGESEWVMILLEKTDYETLEAMVEPGSWKGESSENLRNVTKVVVHLLKSVPQERVPQGADPASITAAFQRAILRSLPRPILKPRK